MILSEEKLMAACIGMSIAGVALLFLVGAVTELPPAEIPGTAEMASGKARVTGLVMDYSDKGSYFALKLAGTGAIEAVSFDPEAARRMNIQRFQEIEATGEARQYKGKSSIIISRMRVLNSTICGGDLHGQRG